MRRSHDSEWTPPESRSHGRRLVRAASVTVHQLEQKTSKQYSSRSMVAKQILFEWTDGDNPEQIVLAGSDFHDETDSLDSMPISEERGVSSPPPCLEEASEAPKTGDVLGQFDANENSSSNNLSSFQTETGRCEAGEANRSRPGMNYKPSIEYKIPIWRFPDDAVIPTQLFMTQRPQIAEKGSVATDSHSEDERFPRYVLVFRRQVHSGDLDTDELLGEIKIERRTSLAELRRIITEVKTIHLLLE